MRTNEQGFTLIELVVVIVILGILAATAIPKFIDLRADARKAAAEGVAAAVSSGFAVNFAARLANSANGVAVSGTTVGVSAAAGSVVGGAGIPSDYTVTAAGGATVACGTGNSAGVGADILVSTTKDGTTQTAAATLICTG